MSSSVLALLGAVLAGAGFGGLYLSLLWAAVQRLQGYRGGVAFFIALTVARAALLLGALAAAAALGVPAAGIVAALLGFVAVRLAATCLLRRAAAGGAAWK